MSEDSVFVNFIGQSNMVGMNMNLETLKQTGWHTDPLTFIWNNQTSQFEVMNPTINTNAFSWGSEVQFAIDFRHNHPDTPLYIVKTSAGQTGLMPGLNSFDDWDPKSPHGMFSKDLARVNAASAVLGKHPEMVVIDQGETDGTDLTASQAYHDNFTHFLDALRSEIMHDPNGYVVWARIPDSVQYYKMIDDAQLRVDQETNNTDSFDTMNFERQPDHIHYDAQGLMSLGDAYEHYYEQHFDPTPLVTPVSIEAAIQATFKSFFGSLEF